MSVRACENKIGEGVGRWWFREEEEEGKGGYGKQRKEKENMTEDHTITHPQHHSPYSTGKLFWYYHTYAH